MRAERAGDEKEKGTSRRSLLAGAAGAMAALAARALGRVGKAVAADGDPLVLGQNNNASSDTHLLVQTGTTAFEVDGFGTGGEAIRAAGEAYGVIASAQSGIAVWGDVGDLPGLIGVKGTGQGGGSIGVYAGNAGVTPGTALKVDGVASFSRSGKAIVVAGTKSVTVTGIPLSAESLVLALAQQIRGGRFVKSAVTDPANSQFVINLNKAPVVNVVVAWFVVN
jgi:hypothetical protein